MDPMKMLKEDHSKVKKLFEEFESAGDRADKKKEKLFEQIRSELDVHMKLEESIFYPAVKKVRSEETKELIREADEEHHVAKLLLAEIAKLEPSAEQYDAKVKVLKENIEHHVEEEEGELFPDAKKRLSDDKLAELGEQMKAKKSALMGSR